MVMDAEENELLTRTGRGTPMGELLRRYWQPVGAASELDVTPALPVRIMGEDLVLYRDRRGSYGLVQRRCPHRGADLSYGMVEDCGIRCMYHGWAFDGEGRCTAQPFEDLVNPTTRFRDGIRAVAYPVEERAGLLFAYLGPPPAPCVPTWEPFTWDNGFRQIVTADVECNWLQCVENNVDPVHFEWLHANWSAYLQSRPPTAARHLKVAVDEWEHGFRYRRLLEDDDTESDNWTVGRLAVLPNVFVPSHFEYRVPIDDTRTRSIVWHYQRVPLERQPYVQDKVPHWKAETHDPVTGRLLTSHVINQDTVAWVGQGPVADRTQEHLGRSDVGVVKLRKQLLADIAAVERGEDPKGVTRDPEAAACIRWPWGIGEQLTRDVTQADFIAQLARPGRSGIRGYFPFYAGQPADVARAFEEAMGVPTSTRGFAAIS